MSNRSFVVAALLAAGTLIAGCGARQAMNNIGFAATRSGNTPPPAQAPAQHPAPPPVPYELSAISSGPVVFFTLKNTGTQPLDIRREHFALVVPGKARRVIPFSDNGGTLDLKQGPLMPSQTLQGRVIFQDVIAPAGNRLVYKPDQTGTFAIIQQPAART